MIKCNKCFKECDGDDVLWATPAGELDGDTRPYCVGCAPEQPRYQEVNA